MSRRAIQAVSLAKGASSWWRVDDDEGAEGDEYFTLTFRIKGSRGALGPDRRLRYAGPNNDFRLTLEEDDFAPVVTADRFDFAAVPGATEVATLEATGGDLEDAVGGTLAWSIRGGVDGSLFNLTSDGVPVSKTTPDATAHRRARGRMPVLAAALSLVALAIPEAAHAQTTDDATLSGLTLSTGTLSPAFASNTESYTAGVGNSVSRITVTPTPSNPDATVAYLDGSDATLPDADSGTDGQQVDLSIGPNVINVQVTAEDRITTKTYTVTVHRANVASPVCDRTPAATGACA